MVITCQHVLQSQELMTNVTNDMFDSTDVAQTGTFTLNPSQSESSCRERTRSWRGPHQTRFCGVFSPAWFGPSILTVFKKRALKTGRRKSFHQNTTETIWEDKQLRDKQRNLQTNGDWVQRKPECCFVAVTLGKRWFIQEQRIRKYSGLCKSKQRLNVRQPVQRCAQQLLIFLLTKQHPKAAAALCNAGALHNPIKLSYGHNVFAFSSERQIKLRLRSV